MFGEDAGSAGAESAEGALQIALAHLLPALLKAQVTTACPQSLTVHNLTSMTLGLTHNPHFIHLEGIIDAKTIGYRAALHTDRG